MKFKKLAAIAMSSLLTLTLVTGCSTDKKAESDKPTVAIVLGEGSINDQSFNQSTWEGLKKAKEDFGVNIKYLESQQDSDYVSNVESFVDQEADLIVGVGFQLKDTIEEMAKNYPDQQFAILDETYDKVPSNVTTVTFKEQEGAYLAGYLAGQVSETKNVGFIGGIEASPAIQKYHYGFKAGAESVDGVKVNSQYANTFSDAAKGKAIANQMISSGSDVVFAAAGATGVGSIEACKENNKKAIGVDIDQSYIAPETVISSAIKKMNVASYDLAKMLVEGKLTGGQSLVYGIKENGIGLSENTSKNVSKEIMDEINIISDKIVNGEIKVPATEKEYESMK
ncbi:BMP family lipoprotein [Paraclostridium bifermentans]|uniref:BMP family lipoprotein n=1 Tax=Paraclostridium bifermentans TaxID=1490 RepID=UPI00359C47A9